MWFEEKCYTMYLLIMFLLMERVVDVQKYSKTSNFSVYFIYIHVYFFKKYSGLNSCPILIKKEK